MGGHLAERRFKAFISYSHRDRAIANWLHHALETYHLPQASVADGAPARLNPIFKDREELPAAESLGAQIDKAIAASDALIVLCSPDAAQSPWIAKEVDAYKRLHGDRGVFPVIVAGDPPANFPAPLLVRYADGAPTSEPAEPIAADLRPDGDGRKLATLKLVAGLTGIELDMLVQRDAARRQKRLALVAAASVLGMVGTSGLALYAIDQRNDAREQRAEADGLIEYMLTDLRTQLEPVGRLELLDGVGKRAMDYYARQKLGDLSASELGRRVRAVQLVAEVQNLRGNNADALPAFRQAARTTAELLARAPDDPERMFNHGQSLFWVGYIAWQHGQADEARRNFEQYADISTRLARRDPANLDWQMEDAYAQSNLGTMEQEAGQLTSALARFQRSARIVDAVSKAEGRPIARETEVGEGLSWVSSTQEALGQIDAAIATRRQELDLYARLLALDPTDADVLRANLFAQSSLGGLLLLAGQRAEAARNLDAAIAIAEGQIAADPENTLPRELVRGALRNRAWLAWQTGERGQATTLFERAERLQAELQRRDPKNVEWSVNDLAELRLTRALSDKSGDPPVAMRELAGWMRAKVTPDHPNAEWLLVGAHLIEGQAWQREGRSDEAQAAYRKALAVPTHAQRISPRALTLRAVAADALKDPARAEASRARLSALGLRPVLD